MAAKQKLSYIAFLFLIQIPNIDVLNLHVTDNFVYWEVSFTDQQINLLNFKVQVSLGAIYFLLEQTPFWGL